MNYICKNCGMKFDVPRIKEAPSKTKVMWILIIAGFFTCGLGWLCLPLALIKQKDKKLCPHCNKELK